jgi:electron transport complex protein RnfG
MKDFMKPTLALLCITLFAAVIIGVTFYVTEEPIRAQRAHIEGEAIMSLFPAAHRFTYILLEENESTLTRVARCYDLNNELLGYVFSALPIGYSGRIHMMVALCTEGTVRGVRIIHHTETPGLGANITQPWFTDGFMGFSHTITAGEAPIIASSTISVQAVLRGVNDAIAYFYAHGEVYP